MSERVAIVTLGRYGDICVSLPLAWLLYHAGDRVTFVTSPLWASILEGVSYCDSLTYVGPYSEPMGAKYWCESSGNFDRVLVPQCYGQTMRHTCANFCEEAWYLAGMKQWFGKAPLVFDRRDPVREAKLIPDFKKPMVLVATTGLSSPFQHTEALWTALKPLRDQYELVDLAQVHGDRFFDLLGLYEKAAWLVAIDSGPLHLADAAPSLKVVGLISDSPSPWFGSPAKPNHVLRIPYSQFTKRAREIADVIARGSKLTQKCVHVWSDYPRTDPEAIRRHNVAKQTWATEFGSGYWTELAVPEKGFIRNAKANFGERKAAPFFGDLIDRAVKEAGKDDVLVFTNDDTCIVPGAGELLREEVPKCGAVYCSRREVPKFDAPLTKEKIFTGGKHVGADIFAFTVEWWKRWGKEMPDMLIAFEAFDLVLRKLITMRGGKELENCCYHENHAGDWTKNRFTRGAIHNRQTAGRWLQAHGVPWGLKFANNTAPRVWPNP